MTPLIDWLGPKDAEARAARISALWTGFLTSWKLLPLAESDAAFLAATRRWLEEATQAIVDEGE